MNDRPIAARRTNTGPATDPLYSTFVDSPCEPLFCVVDERGRVVHVEFAKGRSPAEVRAAMADEGYETTDSRERTIELRRQLEQYFTGERQDFDLELAPRGTDFQLAVWRALREIPYGVTRSYGELAAMLGRPSASRAVGRANATNPIPVIVPCHRVIGADGSLTGFGGGLQAKSALLELEARHRPSDDADSGVAWQRRLA
jgi:methylated-DNA-[protein]-cysteine S-methyltransferase